MKKIAYIEIDTHAEIAQGFMEIMQDSDEFAVDYYFSEKIKKQVTTEGESVFLSDSSMILDQLKLKKYDLVIIGTVHRYFNIFLLIVQKYNTAVIVHNLNFIQSSKFHLIRNIFKEDIVYRLKLWWKEGLLSLSKVHGKAKCLLVLDQGLSSEKYKVLPLFYTKNFVKSKNAHIIIVIPGGVSQKRRDYLHVFKTIQNLRVLENENYTFVFLGKAEGHELKKLQNLSESLPQNITIKYFADRVPSSEFENWMQKADILWCPVQPETEFFSQKERYGITKMTGNLGDAIKYGKQAVFPGNYPSKLQFIISEQENVTDQFKKLKNQVFDFQKSYGKEIIRERLEEVLKSLVTT